MKCTICKKKTDEDNSFHTKDKKNATCEDCINKLLKTAKCCMCDRKIKNRGFSYFSKNRFGKHKFMCIDCIKGVKKIKDV